MSVACHGEDDFTLITAATAQWHDYEWLARDLAPGLSLTDQSRDLSTLIVTGPEARALLEAVGTEADLHLPWLSHQQSVVAGRTAGWRGCPSQGERAGKFMPKKRIPTRHLRMQP